MKDFTKQGQEYLFSKIRNNRYYRFLELFKGVPLSWLTVSAGCLLCATFFSSCQDDVVANVAKGDTTQELQIEVYNERIAEQQTKGLILDRELPDNSKIGLTMAEEALETYDGKTFNNLLYQYAGGKWTTSAKVYLSNIVGKVYAYYPYSESVTDITAIPVNVSTDTDYMYAKNAISVSATNPLATLEMAHAMTAVTVKVVKGNYTHTGTITGLTWQSTSAAKSALLNAKTGGFHNTEGANEAFDAGLTSSNTTTLAAQSSYLWLAVPAGVSGSLLFTMQIDGQTFTAQSAPVELNSGVKYSYTLEVNGKEMAVSAVTITDWVDNPMESIKPSL